METIKVRVRSGEAVGPPDTQGPPAEVEHSVSGAMLARREDLSAGGAYPRRFGKYLLLEPLGHGGMGQVYLARQTALEGIDRYCVVKTLIAQHSDNREYLGRFLDEARLAVHLNHRNICGLSDVGIHDDVLFLAMEVIVGRDLKTVQEHLVERDRRIPDSVALYLIREILEALDYAHRLEHPVTGEPFHIVHRDVSPANVMLSFEGEVKLIDFGLASSRLKQEHTQGDYVMGKLSYMAPEQAANQTIDARTDQFAAAILAYELLAGERYYEGLIPEAVWKRAGTGEHQPRRLDEFDPGLKAILQRALSRDPNDRFPTCAGFRQAIDDYRLERSLVATMEEVRTFMMNLFPGGLAAHRELLSRFSHIDLEPLIPAEAPRRKPISVPEGVPVGSGPVPVVRGEVSGPFNEADVLTDPLGQRPGGSPNRLLYGALLGGILALSVAVVSLALGGPGGRGDSPGSDPVATATPASDPGGPASTAPTPEGPVTPAETSPADSASAPVAAVAPTGVAAADPPSPQARPAKEPARRTAPPPRRVSRTPAKRTAPARVSSRSSGGAPQASESPPKRPAKPAAKMTASEKLAVLGSCSKPCADDQRNKRGAFSKGLNLDALNRCVEQCR